MRFGTEQQWSYYRKELATYWAQTRSPVEFVKLMRVRLALSKVGKIVTPRPIRPTVRLAALGPVQLRSHTTDISVLADLLVSDTYVPAVDPDLGPVRTLVDLGANTGLAACWFARQLGDPRVVCVEPEPSNVEALRVNVARLAGSVVHPVGVGGYRRSVTLDRSNGEFGVRISDETQGSTDTVQVLTMEEILSDSSVGSIDLLKCDIEGSEVELFSSCRPWIGRVRAMVIECHGGFRVADLVQVLADNGATFTVRHLAVDAAFDNEVGVLVRQP